ncbi:MAG: adenylate/guanylate cyclase domain-containing protein [Treponema sp.]|nr:adenylate/guanylate cyclase domain-containing protein [Treponema sp.]
MILVLLDQNSIDWANKERGWGWPWPRKAYAELVNYMNTGGANSIAFDVIFSEPSIYRNARQDAIIDEAVQSLENVRNNIEDSRTSAVRERQAMGSVFRNVTNALQTLSTREDDASFVEAEKKFGRVVQTVFFSSQTGNADSWPADLDKPLFQTVNFGSVLSNYDIKNAEAGAHAQFPIPDLRNAAGILGNITGQADSDSVFRRNRIFTLFDGKAVPGLSAASLLVSGADRQIAYNEKKRIIEWGEYAIPVNHEGKAVLNFRGNLDRYIPYFASDVLQSAEAYEKGETPLLPPEDFAGKYVFFGYYAPGLFDIVSTPISSVYPGVGMHITMLDNLLQGDFIRESPSWLALIMIFALVVLITFLTLFSKRISVTTGGVLLIIAALLAAAFSFYLSDSLWLPIAAPLFGILAAFIVATLYNYATEGSQKRFIKSAFSRYLSPKVIDQIIADPSKLNLGGEKREMTAIFTDIQRFSSISEGLQKEYGEDGPKALVSLLNLYLTEMSNIVLENGGTIDKYEGDAIIAFFGAPIWTEKHAALACRSAIQMKKREKELLDIIMKVPEEASAKFIKYNEHEGAFGLPLRKLIESKAIRSERPLYTRIGVNSGDMVVGNMGTPDKMDYTIMGNAVNLAARLEGVNKQYDTSGILISEYTRDIIGDEFVIRGLSRVRVVGVNTPLRLYELLDTREDASPRLLKIVEVWDQGFAAYEKKNFPEALKAFKAIYQANENDLVAKKYLDRCEKYIAVPPSEKEWDDGVDNLTEK